MENIDMNKEWEKLWKKAKGSVYQSPTWAKAKKAANEKPFFLVIEEENKLKAGFLAFEKIKRFPVIGEKKFFLSEGHPLAINQDYQKKILKKFSDYSQRGFYGLNYLTVVDPRKEMFEQADYSKITNHTILIDLKRPKEEIWKSLEKKSSRWGVKTAEKNNLIFEQAKTEQEIDEFYNLYEKTANDGGFEPEKIDFLKVLADTPISKLFLIKQDKKIIGGGLILLDFNNNYSILNLTSCSEQGLQLQAMPFLYWNLILYSKSIRLDYFDLGGYDTKAKKGDKFYNINKFKDRFGGDVTPQFIFSTNKKYVFLRNILDKSQFLKNLYRKNS